MDPNSRKQQPDESEEEMWSRSQDQLTRLLGTPGEGLQGLFDV